MDKRGKRETCKAGKGCSNQVEMSMLIVLTSLGGRKQRKQVTTGAQRMCLDCAAATAADLKRRGLGQLVHAAVADLRRQITEASEA